MRRALPLLASLLVGADAPIERGLVAVPTASPEAAAPRRIWAVVVGVADYAHGRVAEGPAAS